mgnify:FL=1
MERKKFLVKIETPGLLINLKGKFVRTPVTIIATEDEIPSIKLQVGSDISGCVIEPIYNSNSFQTSSRIREKVEEKTIIEKTIEEKQEKNMDLAFSESVDIEELSIKYETLLDKMIKSTK